MLLEHGLAQQPWHKKEHLKSQLGAPVNVLGPPLSSGCDEDLRPQGGVSESDFSGDSRTKALAESTPAVLG